MSQAAVKDIGSEIDPPEKVAAQGSPTLTQASNTVSMKSKPPKAQRDERGKFNRRKLTYAERSALEAEFTAGPSWDTAKQKEIGRKMSFSRAKVYKWHYDRMQRYKTELKLAKMQIPVESCIS